MHAHQRPYSLSEFGGLWNHQNNPAGTNKCQSVHHFGVRCYTKEKDKDTGVKADCAATQTGKVNMESGKVNPETGKLNMQTGQVNTEAGKVNTQDI